MDALVGALHRHGIAKYVHDCGVRAHILGSA